MAGEVEVESWLDGLRTRWSFQPVRGPRVLHAADSELRMRGLSLNRYRGTTYLVRLTRRQGARANSKQQATAEPGSLMTREKVTPWNTLESEDQPANWTQFASHYLVTPFTEHFPIRAGSFYHLPEPFALRQLAGDGIKCLLHLPGLRLPRTRRKDRDGRDTASFLWTSSTPLATPRHTVPGDVQKETWPNT